MALCIVPDDWVGECARRVCPASVLGELVGWVCPVSRPVSRPVCRPVSRPVSRLPRQGHAFTT
eukprot:9241414-Alexandrium_andersonii.AAC.1